MSLILIKSFLPEIFFSICILFQLLFNVSVIKNFGNNFPIVDKEVFTQTCLLLVGVLFLTYNSRLQVVASNSLLLNDLSCLSIKSFILVCSLCVLPLVYRSLTLQNLNFFEFFSVFLLSTFSTLLLVSCHDFIMIYLLLEMQVLCYYILASFKRGSAFSTESGLKYFIVGSFFSCVFLLGCFILYMSLGTLNLSNIQILLSFPLLGQFLYLKQCILFGIMLVFITFFFKISCAPVHFWSPDVYDGSPLSSSIVFGVLSKVAIFYVIVKCIYSFSILFFDVQNIFMCSGIFSLFIGTFFALRQKRLKRLIIYSSIAQTGFMVISLSTGNFVGFISLYFFLFIYILTSLLLWNNLVQFTDSHTQSNGFYSREASPIFVSNLINLNKSNRVLSLQLCLGLFSLAGIPPFCGFLAEIIIFHSLVNSGYIFVVLLVVAISSISVYYYIRLVKVMVFEKNHKSVFSSSGQVVFFNLTVDLRMCISTLSIFFLFFFFLQPEFLLNFCSLLVIDMCGV